MSHEHHHNSKNIKVAFILKLTFSLAEIIGGLWTNSMAVLSDALHDLGDSLSLGLAWFLQNYSQKKPDSYYTFGYSRFSLLGALINSLILIGGSIFILSEAIPRLLNPESIKPLGMLFFAIGGIIVNGLAAFKLSKGNSLNEKVVSWHLIEDLLGWTAVFLVSILLLFKNIPVLDPILSIIITLYVLYNVARNLIRVLKVFLLAVPEHISVKEIEQKIKDNVPINSVYHTHIWSLDGERTMMSTHIVVNDNTDKDQIKQIKKEVRDFMKEKSIEYVTLEIDYESEERV